MAGQKLTEKTQATVVKQAASFVVTQLEGPTGSEKESVRRVQISAMISALRGFGLMTGYYTSAQIDTILDEYVKNVEAVEGGIRITYGNDEHIDIPVATEGGADLSEYHMSFDTGTGYLHMYDSNDVDVFDPVWIGGGGGGSGGGSTLTFSMYTDPAFSVIESAGEAEIEYKFTSIDKETEVPTGSGNLAIYVGGIMKTNMTVQQGDHLTVDVFSYLTTGTNNVRLTMTDSYGNTATRTFTITMESFALAWNLGDTNVCNTSDFSFYVTPTGNGSKSIYTKLDGTIIATDTVTTSGRRLTKNLSNLTHGAHTIEVYGTVVIGGVTLESNHLIAAVAVALAGESAPVIAVKWPDGPLTQYTSVNIPYIVVDPNANPATIQLMEDNDELNEIDVDQSPHVWAYRPLHDGYKLVKIKRGSTVASKQYAIQGLDIDVEEITDGLTCKIDPSTISDLSSWSYGNYHFTLSQNFDLVNGGLIVDSDGAHCIRIAAGDTLTLNLDPFAENAISNGLELKFVYKIMDTSSKTAHAIHSLNSGRGLDIQPNAVYLTGNQNSATLSLCEGEKTELDVNIQQLTENGDRLMMIWEKCSSFAFKQYADDENFRHSENVGITFGCADADVYLYLFRAYGRDLTTAELRANYIVDGADGNEIAQRNTRNAIYDNNGVNFELAAQANPDMDCVLISAEKMSTAKKKAGGSVPCTIRHVRVSGGAAHAWTATGSMDLQGTSSEEHALNAGPNLNWRLTGGIEFDDGSTANGWAMHGTANSVPVNLFNFKKNIASQDHIVNRVAAEWYNRYQPAVRQARVTDPRVRDCLESTMVAVFFHNTSNAPVVVGPDTVNPDETIFFGLGNICSSKDCYDTFEYDDIVIEVKQNPSDIARFKDDDLSGSNWDQNYEFRYLNEDVYSEAQAKALWQVIQTFVYKTDYTEATGDLLDTAEVIGGTTYTHDTAAYRKAKWIAEAPNHFEMDTLYWHHCITLFFLLRDNRAKNMFWSYNTTLGKWALRFNWDNDTGLCRNNQGYVDIEPGYMDWDTIGTDNVFNAADNALFTSLRENNFAQLQAMYRDRETAGAWDLDAIFNYIKESQDQVCESLWIEDAEHNAIRILENMGNTSYLERATGRLQLHMKKALMFQKALVDSYFLANASTTDRARLRTNTPQTWAGVEPNGSITLTAYTDMYINLLAGATPYRVRATAGVPVTIDIVATLGNTETYIYGAQWIQDLGDLSALYLQQFEIDTMRRVKKVILGTAEDGYYNTGLPSIGIANCVKLEELNVAGVTNLAASLNLSHTLYLKKFDSRNSGVTGVRFAKNGRLQEAKLNALTSLYMSGLWNLSTFSISSYDNLGTLTVENCDNIDALSIVEAAESLENLRVIGINWTLDSTDLLNALLEVGSINDNGVAGDPPCILVGSVYVPILRQSESTAYAAAWPNLTVTYGRFINQHTVTFKNYDGTTLWTESVDQGSDAVDPVSNGDISTPTKPSTDEYSYSYRGWDSSLSQISAPKTITAQFNATKRTYTVKWYSKGILVDEQTVEYGDEAVYAGNDPTYTMEEPMLGYYLWTGQWDKSTARVTANMSVNAVFEYADLSMTPASTEDMTAAYLYGLRQRGSTFVRNALQTKDRILIRLGYEPSYDNVEDWESQEDIVFDGVDDYLDTGLDFLKNGIDAGWTLAIDFEFKAATNNAVLMSMWQDDGYMGFKLRYNTSGTAGPTVVWGTSPYNTQQGLNREIIVLRHMPGSQQIYCYSSNTGNMTIGLTALSKAIDTQTTHHLILGCDQNDQGDKSNYASGIVHKLHVWYADLGNADCQKIAAWPRELICEELTGYAQFPTTADATVYTDADFISAGELQRLHRMNATNTNADGYAATEMVQWLEDRVLPAFPKQWRQIMKEVKVPYVNRVSNNVGEVLTMNAKIFLPSLADVQSQSSEPWIYEGRLAPWFVDNPHRAKHQGHWRRENAQYFSQNTDPALLDSNNVEDGDIWTDTGNGSIVKLRVNGAWLSAYTFWLRGANLSGTTYFWNVNTTGGTNSTNATNAYGVVLRFSI